jgi:hypothetical protein
VKGTKDSCIGDAEAYAARSGLRLLAAVAWESAAPVAATTRFPWSDGAAFSGSNGVRIGLGLRWMWSHGFRFRR